MTGVSARSNLASFITETKKGQVALERRQGGRSAALVPPGGIIPFAGAIPPRGWLLCDGTDKSRETYGRLFDVIGEDFGPGDGTTTFGLPDIPPLVAGVNYIIKV